MKLRTDYNAYRDAVDRMNKSSAKEIKVPRELFVDLVIDHQIMVSELQKMGVYVK